ncbi:MAG TPA: hypothetical protein VF659_09230 [Pyrinomonadaceae bacterium]|jgi:hypothetical protein
MLTVRFPDGFSVTYNQATKAQFGSAYHTLLNSKGEWVAIVPSSCIIEAGSPCNFSNPNRQPSAMVSYVLAHLREMPLSSLRHLKRELQDFDSTKGRWK